MTYGVCDGSKWMGGWCGTFLLFCFVRSFKGERGKGSLPSGNHPPYSTHCTDNGHHGQYPRSHSIFLRDRVQRQSWIVGPPRAGRGIADAGASRRRLDRRLDLFHQKSLKDFHGRELFANASAAVVLLPLRPFQTARLAVRPARALQGRRAGGFSKSIDDPIVHVRSHFRGRGHPSRHEGFEGFVVVVARVDRFARGFEHDVGLIFGIEDFGPVENPIHPFPPFLVTLGLRFPRGQQFFLTPHVCRHLQSCTYSPLPAEIWPGYRTIGLD